MKSPKTALSAVLLAIAIIFSVVKAQESTIRARPERFLMLLKKGDRIAWGSRTADSPSGYRVIIYSEERYQELAKHREARKKEFQKPEAERSEEFKDFAKSRSPLDVNQIFGQVTHVGSDYIAVQLSEPEWEMFIPAWSIISIVRPPATTK